MEWVLGTAQFGLDYGITNQTGQCSENAINEILTLAKKEGIQWLDTAPAYGNSELLLSSWAQAFHIITKIPPYKNQYQRADYVRFALNQSLLQLKRNYIDGILFHCVDDLMTREGPILFNAALALKNENKCHAVGVSIYEPYELQYILDHYGIDWVQLPFNIFDQRFVPYFKELNKRNIRIFARSIFLQGLLLNLPVRQSSLSREILDYLTNYYLFLRNQGISPLMYALQFIKYFKEINYLLMGVTSVLELKNILETAKKLKLTETNFFPFPRWEKNPPAILLDPRRWYQ